MAVAPVSLARSARLAARRAASATLMPALLKARASDADTPGPTPTINAVRYPCSAMMSALLPPPPSPPAKPGLERHAAFADWNWVRARARRNCLAALVAHRV